MLKAGKADSRIQLDSETTLAGILQEVWHYKFSNRSALERILDQHKEKVVDLLARVTTVSVETQRIVGAMKTARH